MVGRAPGREWLQSRKENLIGKAFTDLKRQAWVPEKLFACHTAVIDGYVIEGHVPADCIHKLRKKNRRFSARRSGHAGRVTGHGRR